MQSISATQYRIGHCTKSVHANNLLHNLPQVNNNNNISCPSKITYITWIALRRKPCSDNHCIVPCRIAETAVLRAKLLTNKNNYWVLHLIERSVATADDTTATATAASATTHAPAVAVAADADEPLPLLLLLLLPMLLLLLLPLLIIIIIIIIIIMMMMMMMMMMMVAVMMIILGAAVGAVAVAIAIACAVVCCCHHLSSQGTFAR